MSLKHPSEKTWHLHLKGQVQGVGFRPFVYRLAHSLGLQGWVNNTVDGVHVLFNAHPEAALKFSERVTSEAPILARITDQSLQETPYENLKGFHIVESGGGAVASLLLTPDVALCPDCQSELFEPSNRRFRYPFITCTNCGPRYSIIQELPYDRPRTTMRNFEMCTPCDQEYFNPMDRRHFSQTNSCPECPIRLQLFEITGIAFTSDQEQLLSEVVQRWKAGAIIAIKGIGGYLLTCDAQNAAAIQRLRKRKHRPSKPFAVMFPSLSNLEEHAIISTSAADLLESIVAPIVLLPTKKDAPLALQALAPELDQIGAMLPYAPLFELLLHAFGGPIVATSGNISKAPIVFRDNNALKDFSGIADAILTNDRPIAIPQDDSVVRLSPKTTKRIILRRSRGWAPTFIQGGVQWPEQSVLAMGAQLKSTFTLLQQGNVYISQYLGDLDQFDTQMHYRHTLHHMMGLLQASPAVVLTDLHPEYAATQLGQHYAAENGLPIFPVQHHKAHFAAILGEQRLIDLGRPILGVIWDGTGWGTDQQIWGGEFFLFENKTIQRIRQWAYFPFILGDKMPKEPRISALALAGNNPTAHPLLQEKFTPTEWSLYLRMIQQANHLRTSSVGRLFDGIASLLGLADKQSYEGEAAMRLEQLAKRYFEHNSWKDPGYYVSEFDGGRDIPSNQLVGELIADLLAEKPKDWIAAKFHRSLIWFIEMIAEELGVQHLAFSGGVWQNAVLVDLASVYLEADFQLHFHQELSPNDENISFGQLVYWRMNFFNSQ